MSEKGNRNAVTARKSPLISKRAPFTNHTHNLKLNFSPQIILPAGLVLLGCGPRVECPGQSPADSWSLISSAARLDWYFLCEDVSILSFHSAARGCTTTA